MVVLRSSLLLFSLCFFSGEAFNVSHFKEFPLHVDTASECIHAEQYWSFVADYCPGSSDDHSELHQHRMMVIFTNSSTEPQLIHGTSVWLAKYSMLHGQGIRGSLAENNRCGRCGKFLPCRTTGTYKIDYEPFVRAIELYKANQLGVEMFIWMQRKSGITGDNEMNYYPSPTFFEEYDDPGNRHRYSNGKNSGAIRYKRLKVIGFLPIEKGQTAREKMDTEDNSEFVLADVVNDCDKLDPKTALPSHGMYRLMINGEPRGKKSSFWWKSQYYFPLAGDYFT